MLSETDLLRSLQTLGAGAAVREVMRKPLPSASPNDPLHAAQQKMLTGRTRALPVLNAEGDLLGLLTVNDINEAYRLAGISPKLAFSRR